MDGIALNNNMALFNGMEKTKNTKKEVMNRIKNKLENAKLELIYVELEELGISVERKYSSVKELTNDLKGKISELDYNKVNQKVNEIEESLNQLVKELENNSTNAFTKVMTSDLSKTIAKSLGITLAGRAALILAPTIGTKALVGASLAGYGLYKVIKNRKEIIKINETNELNNILMDLETTKQDGKYLDTRFNEETQKIIRDFLNNNHISFEDTGYRSLRQKIYSLEDDKKRSLCELLNANLGKGIEIDKRVEKAKKKLNVAASSVAAASTGALLGVNAATVINSVDPAIVAGPLNGTVLAAWINSISEKEWFGQLAGGLGAVGSGVLEHVPVIGGAVSKFLAAENLASFATIGAAGGLAVGAGLGVASIVKRVHTNKMNKKEMEEFLKLDTEKYLETDKPELTKIQEKLHEPQNIVESVIVDIVVGYLKEQNINYEGNPTTIHDLKEMINKLPKEDKKKATDIMNKIVENLDKDPDFVKGLKKAGKISIGLFTTGLAALSVYDLIKGGTFLPELSQKIFPTNNINAPVPIPEDLDADLNMNLEEEANIHASGESIHNEFTTDPDKYMIEENGDSIVEYGYNYGVENPGIAGYSAENALIDYGQDLNFIDNVMGSIKGLFGGSTGEEVSSAIAPAKMMANTTAICDKLNSLTPKELYNFYRYFNSLKDDGTPMYAALKEVLGYNNMIERATSVITDAENIQKMNNIINNITGSSSTGMIPVAAGVGAVEEIQKDRNIDVITNQEEEIRSISK